MLCMDLSETALLASVQADTYSSLYFDMAIDEPFCKGFKTDIENYDSVQIQDYLLDPDSVDAATFYDLSEVENEAPYCQTSHLFNKMFNEAHVLILMNQQRFDTSTYGKSDQGGPIVNESKLEIVKFPVQPLQETFKIQQTLAARDDNRIMAINGFTNDLDTLYSTGRASQSSNTEAYNTRYSVIFELDNDVQVIDRSVFNLFVLLSDVGGLYGLFISAISTILIVINYQKADNFLVDNLYMHTDKENKKLVVEKRTRQSALKEYFQSTCLSCICRTSKQDRYYAKARDKLSEETDLAEILRAIRLFRICFVQLFSEESRNAMKEIVDKISVRSSCDLEKIASKLALEKNKVNL